MKAVEAKAPRNRTLRLIGSDIARLSGRLMTIDRPTNLKQCLGRTIHGDSLRVLRDFERNSVDLMIVDPPYNITKEFGETTFKRRMIAEYEEWFRCWLMQALPILKPTATVYVCSEWRSSSTIQRVLEDHFVVHNRITWEREKGRGALRNWKNCSEDIWFCTVGRDFFFDVDAVKQKRRVIAPYRDARGEPKDWSVESSGNFRLTHPSNLWTDITVPFWSMPENTDHPTQKPEKLIAKLVLASSRPGDVVLDPFLGSGTTSVVSKKLGRRFVGIEQERPYCLIAERRLELADAEPSIQGYVDGCFWERNTLSPRSKRKDSGSSSTSTVAQFVEHQA